MFRSALTLFVFACYVFDGRVESVPAPGRGPQALQQDPVVIFAVEGDQEAKQQPNRRSIPLQDLSGFGGSGLGFTGTGYFGTSGLGLNTGLGINSLGVNSYGVSGLNGMSSIYGYGAPGLSGYGTSGMYGFGTPGLTGYGTTGLNGYGLSGLNGYGMNGLTASGFGLAGGALNPGLLTGTSFGSTGTFPATSTMWNNPTSLSSMNWSQYSNPFLFNSNVRNVDLTTLQLLANNPSYYARTGLLGNSNLYNNGLSNNNWNSMLLNRNVYTAGLGTQQLNPFTDNAKRSVVPDPQSPFYTSITNSDEKEETTSRTQKRTSQN